MTSRASLVLSMLALAFSAPLAHAQLAIPWFTIDNGGGSSSGGTFTVIGTIGQPDAGQALVGGTFTVTGGFWAGASAPACRADFNADNVANSQDFFEFLTAFFSQAPSADFNGDGQVNSQDFFDFLAAFFAGC